MTTYSPYCLGYATWKNNDGSLKTRQIKKFPKNVTKEILQSFFRNVALDILEEESNQSSPTQDKLFQDENFIKIGQIMIDEFRKNEVYNLKTKRQCKIIEDFLRFHPETIELGTHPLDRKYFELTDNFEIIKIKKSAPPSWVLYLFDVITDNLENIDFAKNKDSYADFILKNIENTDYFTEKTKDDQDFIVSYIKENVKPKTENSSEIFFELDSTRSRVENFIIKQTINYHKNRS